jgi:hypothetical protein
LSQTKTKGDYMSFESKVKALEENIDNGYQCLGEHESQFASECAMFGDAGPGQALTIQSIKEDLAKEEKELARLMATPIGKALKVKRDREYAIEKEKYKHDDEWPF